MNLQAQGIQNIQKFELKCEFVMMDTLEDLPGLKKVKILQSKYQLGADIYEADDRKNTV